MVTSCLMTGIRTRWRSFLIIYALTFTHTEATTCAEIARTENYAYHLCDKMSRNFEESRQVCHSNVADGELATLPSKAEYDALLASLVTSLNGTDPGFYRFFLGLRQRESTVDEFNPQTGEFYWLTEPDEIITVNTTDSYWQPLGKWITDFQSLGMTDQTQEVLIMSATGVVQRGHFFGSSRGAEFDVFIICISRDKKISLPFNSAVALVSAPLTVFFYLIYSMIH